ncbi:MAG: hypothetical protein F6K53_37955 [Moorea sp. SIO4A1]|uniref:hypothetical protein n=1 Tax=Moorena sp. SIO4A1 TaxID=2607835 RepID=UPI00144E57EF|nr:hypothetical protein [Moorena sp. SIO4A1]NEQ62843.1 hypothetical protein [Moorena sp. SIO4A1]
MNANCSIDCSLFPIPCSMSPISSKITRACWKNRKPNGINGLSYLDSCLSSRKSGKIRQNPCTAIRENVPKS